MYIHTYELHASVTAGGTANKSWGAALHQSPPLLRSLVSRPEPSRFITVIISLAVPGSSAFDTPFSPHPVCCAQPASVHRRRLSSSSHRDSLNLSNFKTRPPGASALSQTATVWLGLAHSRSALAALPVSAWSLALRHRSLISRFSRLANIPSPGVLLIPPLLFPQQPSTRDPDLVARSRRSARADIRSDLGQFFSSLPRLVHWIGSTAPQGE